jgi:hypothetical protein
MKWEEQEINDVWPFRDAIPTVALKVRARKKILFKTAVGLADIRKPNISGLQKRRSTVEFIFNEFHCFTNIKLFSAITDNDMF